MFSIFFRLFFAICFPFSGIKTSLTTSVVPNRTPIFANILQSIDAAESDEHLYNVTLQFLKDLCQCLNENFKGGNSFDTTDVLIWNDENSSYKKVNDSTCTQLQQQISQKIDWIDLNEARYREENDRRQAYFIDQSNNSFSYDVEEILYQTLIESKDVHNYSIHKYSLLRRKTILENPTHNVIVIFTFQSKNNDQKNSHLDENDIKKLIHINSSIAIDLIDTKYEKSFEENANTKSDTVSLCNLYSIYNFLALHHKNNRTHVFKVLRKYQSVKIYLDVITDHVHDDLTMLCCVNGSLASSCKERISIQNTNLEKYVLKVGAFRNTLQKIKSLVKIYTENSELNASEMDINECDKMKNDENILQNKAWVHESFPKKEINHNFIEKEKIERIWKSYNSTYGSVQNSFKTEKLSKRHTTEVVSPSAIPNVSFINKIDKNITTTEVKSSQSTELAKPIVLESNPMIYKDKLMRMTDDQHDMIYFPDTAMPTSNFNRMVTNHTSSFTLPLENNTLNQRSFTTAIVRDDYEENNHTNFAKTNSYFTIQLSVKHNNFSIGPNISFKKMFVTLDTNENDVSKDFSNFDNRKIPITTQYILSDTRRSPTSSHDFQEKYQPNLIEQSTSNNDSFISTTTIGSFEKNQTHALPLISQTETYVSKSIPVYLSNRQSVTMTKFKDISPIKFGTKLKEENFSTSQNLLVNDVLTTTQVDLANAHKFILPTSSNGLQHNDQTYVPASLQFRGSNDLSSQNVSTSTQNNLTLKNYMQGKYETNLKDLIRQQVHDVTKDYLTSRQSLRRNYDTYRTPYSQTNEINHIKRLNISTSTQNIFKNSPAMRENFEYNGDIYLKKVKNYLSSSTISQNNIINGQSLVTTTTNKNINENNTEPNYVLTRRFSSTKSSNNQNTSIPVSTDEFQKLSTALYLTDQPLSISETFKNIQDKSSVQHNLRSQEILITTPPIQSSQQSLITTIKGSKKKSTPESRTAIKNFTGPQILSLATPYHKFHEKVTEHKSLYYHDSTTPVIRSNLQENNRVRFEGEKTHAHATHHQLTSSFSKVHNFSSTTLRFDNVLVQIKGENNNDFRTSVRSIYKENKEILLSKTHKSTGLTINNNAKNKSDLLWKIVTPNLPPDSTYNIYIKNTTDLRKVKYTVTTVENDIIINTKKPQLLVNGENNNDFTTLMYIGNKSFPLRNTQHFIGLTIKNNDNNSQLWKNEVPNLSPDSTNNIYMKDTQAYLSKAQKFILTTSSNDLQHSHQTYVPASLNIRGSNDLSSRNVLPSTQNNLHARLNETTLKKYIQEKYQTNIKDKNKDFSKQSAYGVTKNYLTSKQSLILAYFNNSFRGNHDTYKTANSQSNKYITSSSTQSMFKNTQSPAIRDNIEYYNEDDALKNFTNGVITSSTTRCKLSNSQSLAATTDKNLSGKNIEENNTELNYILNRRFSNDKSDHQNTTTDVSRDEFQELSTSQYLTYKPILITSTLKKFQEKNAVHVDLEEILITTTPKNILQKNITTPIQSSQQSLMTMVKGNEKKSRQENRTINNFTVQQILSLATPYNKFKEKITVQKSHYHPSLTAPVIRDNLQENNPMRFKYEKTHAVATDLPHTQRYFKGYKFSSTTFRYDKILVQMNDENNNDFTTSVISTYKEHKKKLSRKMQKSPKLTISENSKNNPDLLWKIKTPNLPPDSTYNIYIKNTTDLRKVKYRATTADNDIIINTKKPQLLVTQFNITQQNIGKFKKVSTNYFDFTRSTSNFFPKSSDIHFQEKALISTVVPSLLKTVLNKDLTNRRSVHKSNIAVPNNSSAYNVNLKHSSENNQTLILQDNLQYMISNNNTNETLRIVPTDKETNIELNVSSKTLPLGIRNTYITPAFDYKNIEDTIIKISKNLIPANNPLLPKIIPPNILSEHLKPTETYSNIYFKSIKEKGTNDEIKNTLTNIESTTIPPLWTTKKATKHSSTYFKIKTYYPNNIRFNSQKFTTTALFLTPKRSRRIPVIRIGNRKGKSLYSDVKGIKNNTSGYNVSNNLTITKEIKSMIKKNIEGITNYSSPRPFEYNQTDKITNHNLKPAITEYKVNKSKSVATLKHKKDFSTVSFPSETWKSSKVLVNIKKLENSSVKAVTNAISAPHRNNLNRTRALNLSYTTTLSHSVPGKLTYFINRNSYTAKTTPMAFHYASNKSKPTLKLRKENVTRRIYKKFQDNETKNNENEISLVTATNNVTNDDSTLSDSYMNFDLHSGMQLNSTKKNLFLNINKSTTVPDSSAKNLTIQSPISQVWNTSNGTSVQENNTTTLESLQSKPHQGQLHIKESVMLHNRYGKTKNNRAFIAFSSNSLKHTWTTLLPLTEQNIKLWSVKTSDHATEPVQNYAEKATNAIKSQNSEFTNVIKPDIAHITTQVNKEIRTGQNTLTGVTESERNIIFNNTVPTTMAIDNSIFTVQQNHPNKTTEMSILSKYRKPNDVQFEKKYNYFTTELRNKAAKFSNAIGKTKKSINLIFEDIMNTSKKILYNKKPSDITTPILLEKIIIFHNTTPILSSITKVNNGGIDEYNNSTTMNYNTDNVSLLSKQLNKNVLRYNNVNPIRIYNDLIKNSERIPSPVNTIELKVSLPMKVVTNSQRLLKSKSLEVKGKELEIDQTLTTTMDLPVETPTGTFLRTINSVTSIEQNNTAFTKQYPFNNTMGLNSENMNLLGTTFKAPNTKTFHDHLSILKHNFGFDNITSMQNKTHNTLLRDRYKITRTSTESFENKATQKFHLQNRSTSPSQNISEKQNLTNSNDPLPKYCSDVYKAVYLQNIYLNVPILVANHNDINVCNFSYNIVDSTSHSKFTSKQLSFSNVIPKKELFNYLKNISTFISSKNSSGIDTGIYPNSSDKQMSPKADIILTKTAWPMITENKNFAYLIKNPNHNLNLLPTERKFSNIATEINQSNIKLAKVSHSTDFTTALYSSTIKTLTKTSFFNVVKAKSIMPLLKIKKIRYNTYKPKTEEDFDTTILKFNKRMFSTINTIQKAVTEPDYQLSRTTYKEKKTGNKKNKHLNHQKYSGVHKVPVKDMRKIIVHTKSVIDPLAKTNLYPVQRIPSTSQRKVMKRIRLHKNKELLAMNTNDFFSRRHNDVDELRRKSHGILRKGFLTPKPKEYIIRPTFKMIDKPRNFRPKPIIIESDNFYKNNFPRNRGKSLSVIEQVDYVRDTTKEPQTVLERPAYLPPQTKPKFFRDRIDSIRNYVHNSEYLRGSDSAGEIDRYAVFREPEFNFRRYDRVETSTTIRTTVKYTRRKPRTIFFLSPTVPYNRYF